MLFPSFVRVNQVVTRDGLAHVSEFDAIGLTPIRPSVPERDPLISTTFIYVG